MDYGRLLSRAWSIIWEYKFLILLGVLVALASGGNSGISTGSNFAFEQPPGEAPQFPPLPELPRPQFPGPRAPLAIAILTILVIVVVGAIGLAVWVVSIIARGGLIAGASTVDGGGVSSFSQAWHAGWQRGWRLLAIGVIPAIPALLLTILVLGGVAVFGGLSRYLGGNLGLPVMSNVGILVAALSCVLVPIALVLSLLRTFANRACMLEDLGVFASYRRGLEVLLENIGPAVILFLIQIAIGIGILIVSIPTGIVLALCCLLWPLLILVQGAIAAFFSTIWTLAWRRWTGLGAAEETPSVVR